MNPSPDPSRLAVVAIGGNAIYPKGIRGTAEEQLAIARRTCKHLLVLVREGYHLLLTHGNGPQVGNILLRMEMSRKEVEPLPMDFCGAQTQGEIGYLIQQSLLNRLREHGLERPVVSLVTQVEVDPKDPAFQNPTKPVGPFYSEAEAQALRKERGWIILQDAGRGFRRVVPSPRPIAIVEREAVEKLVSLGAIVITAGGGGIPVVRRGKLYQGVEAVIDKDLASSVLARSVKAGLFILLTAVERVCLDFGTPKERPLSRLTASQARRYLGEGQFPPGSMGPKIEAAIDYLEAGGEFVVITSLEKVLEALRGRTGTHIVKDPP